ncbi:MAG TPA: amidohydrolase family protein [Acidimicrobiales bacterium]
MPSRALDYEVFDADNHLYETQDALTKFLPDRHRGAIEYVEVRGRTKIAVRGQISEYIPNPTFDVIARPGAQEEYFRHGNPEGKSYRELIGDPIRCIPAFREPAPRIELMDELGVDRALVYPTLASLLEERMRDDVELTHVAIHALNQWIHETWTFNYDDRIFVTPIITLPIVERAIEELEWVLERGARAVLIRPAPVPGLDGRSRSPGLPEFDQFWQRVVDAGVLVVMHASDSGYSRYVNDWEGTREFLPFKLSAFRSVCQSHRPIEDTMAAMICHGAFSRFPELRVAVVENGSGFVRPLFHGLTEAFRMMPQEFAEDPIEVFKRNVYVHPFHEDDIRGLVDLLGADHILFGSDFPHPEGLADPLSYVDDLEGMPQDVVVKIMGANLAGLMKVGASA